MEEFEIYRLPSPLEFITWKNHAYLLDSILAMGEDINGCYPLRDPPLYCAFKDNEMRYVFQLLEKGAKTDVESFCNGITIADLLEWRENDNLKIRSILTGRGNDKPE